MAALLLARQRSHWFKRLIENEPLLIMRDAYFMEDALR